MLGKKDLSDAGNDLLIARQQIFGTLIGQTILIYIQERVGFSLSWIQFGLWDSHGGIDHFSTNIEF